MLIGSGFQDLGKIKLRASSRKTIWLLPHWHVLMRCHVVTDQLYSIVISVQKQGQDDFKEENRHMNVLSSVYPLRDYIVVIDMSLISLIIVNFDSIFLAI